MLNVIIKVHFFQLQFRDKKNPHGLNIFLGEIKDVMFIFLYHKIGLHFPETMKQ